MKFKICNTLNEASSFKLPVRILESLYDLTRYSAEWYDDVIIMKVPSSPIRLAVTSGGLCVGAFNMDLLSGHLVRID